MHKYIYFNDKKTGQCIVTLDENKIPTFSLVKDVAFDYLQVKDDIFDESFDALSFGSVTYRGAGNYDQVKKIIDAKIGNFSNKTYFQIEDQYKNKFNLYVMSKADYTILRNGTLTGQNSDILDENNLDSLEEDLIKVKTMHGNIEYIPKGSTALDFAFKIHRDIGFGFKYAIINGSKTKSPPYTKIYEGDQIEIKVEKNSKGQIVNCAELRWLAYVNTEFAKKNLIKLFERKFMNL